MLQSSKDLVGYKSRQLRFVKQVKHLFAGNDTIKLPDKKRNKLCFQSYLKNK